MQPDEKPEDLSLTVDTLCPSPQLATPTLTLSADPTVVPLVPASAASASIQVNPTGVTASYLVC